MIKHGEEITILKFYDGEVIGTVTEVRQEQFTDKQYLLKDIIEGLNKFTSGQTKKLTIEIAMNKNDTYKLTQRWRIT